MQMPNDLRARVNRAWEAQYAFPRDSHPLPVAVRDDARAAGDREVHAWANLTIGYYSLRYVGETEARTALELAQQEFRDLGDARGAIRGGQVEGMCGVVQDGVVNGLWGYEAGQACVGDLFAWYMEHGVPASVHAEAKRLRTSVYRLMEQRAAALKPGESGLLALDWWNGCRSVLMDSSLSGLLVGATLARDRTRSIAHWIEATAFGTRKIIEAFTNKSVAIDELYACGGLAQKNPLLLQIYSDVTGRPIRVAASQQTCALGAAMHGALAAGLYANMEQAAKKMVCPSTQT